MASTYYTEGKEQHIRICINRDSLVPPGQPFYCLSAEGLLNTHCCYEDYCNSIDLKVPGKARSSAVTLQACPIYDAIFLFFLHQSQLRKGSWLGAPGDPWSWWRSSPGRGSSSVCC